MAHFKSELWIDYVRGVAAAEDRRRIEDHLAAGCKACGAAVARWWAVVEFAAQEAIYEPPSSAVRVVKSHRLPQSESRSPIAVTIATLVFDTLRAPAPVGVRGANPTSRHMLYKAAHVSIDLRIEPALRSERIVLVGQLVDARPPHKGLRASSLAVMSGQSTIVSTASNAFGEFQLEFQPRDSLVLAVVVDGQAIQIPLEELSGPAWTPIREP